MVTKNKDSDMRTEESDSTIDSEWTDAMLETHYAMQPLNSENVLSFRGVMSLHAKCGD